MPNHAKIWEETNYSLQGRAMKRASAGNELMQSKGLGRLNGEEGEKDEAQRQPASCLVGPCGPWCGLFLIQNIMDSIRIFRGENELTGLLTNCLVELKVNK